MLGNDMNYPSAQVGSGICRPPSVFERLNDEKARCEARLEEVNKALALLEANPGTAEVLEAISKIGF